MLSGRAFGGGEKTENHEMLDALRYECNENA